MYELVCIIVIYSACVWGSPVVPLVGNILLVQMIKMVMSLVSMVHFYQRYVERTPNTRIVDLCSYMWSLSPPGSAVSTDLSQLTLGFWD